MSWQPVVADLPSGYWPGTPGKPPSGKRFGVAMTEAAAGLRSGTFTMVMRSCGGWQSGYVALGL